MLGEVLPCSGNDFGFQSRALLFVPMKPLFLLILYRISLLANYLALFDFAFAKLWEQFSFNWSQLFLGLYSKPNPTEKKFSYYDYILITLLLKSYDLAILVIVIFWHLVAILHSSTSLDDFMLQVDMLYCWLSKSAFQWLIGRIANFMQVMLLV